MAHHFFQLGVGELIRELRAIDGNRGHGAAEESGRSCNQCGHAILTPSSFVSASASRPAPLFSALRTVSTSPPKTGSTSREKDSHQRFPINFRASAVFHRRASPDRLAELSLPACEITTPSISSVLACR